MLDNVDKAYIATYSGRQFFLLDPRVEDIDIHDIAHSLSLQCRWTGHTKYHYSIAQHSFYCSYAGPEGEALERLMHDASEAYIADLNRPMKHYTEAGAAYLKVEARIEDAISKRFGLQYPFPPSVKIADNLTLFAEKAQIMNYTFAEAQDWSGDGNKAGNQVISQWSPEKAEAMFLGRFISLYKGE